MGQEYQHKQDGSHQHKGSKQPQVAQCRSIQRHQTRKGTHRSDIADEQRGNHVLQYLPCRSAVIRMGYEMQRIVHRDTDNDRPYGQDNQRHIAPQGRNKAHGKEPSENDRHPYQQQILHPPEREYQQQQDQRHGDGDSPLAVGLYLTGITDGNHR